MALQKAEMQRDFIPTEIGRKPISASIKAARYLTKSDLARQHIQEMIVSGSVRSGERMTSREVSEALGMSETPIREAMRSLTAEGWLDSHPHLGAVVSSIKREQLVEVFAVRGALEGLAIKLGGPVYTPQRLQDIDSNLAESEQAIRAKDHATYASLNRQFHLLLSDTPATQWTLKTLSNLWAQTSALHRGFEAVPAERIKESLDEHRAIRDAIVAGDFALAAERNEEHERIAGEVLLASLSALRSHAAPNGVPHARS